MAALVSVNPRVVKNPGEIIDTKIILNGQSWDAGQWLYEGTAGFLTACASSADTGTGGIKYVAMTTVTDPVNNTTTAPVQVIAADTIFEIHELDGAITTANIGQQYEISVASNVVTVDVSATDNAGIEVVEIGPSYNELENASGDTLARMRVKVLTTAIDAVPA